MTDNLANADESIRVATCFKAKSDADGVKNYTLFETLLHFWCQKRGDGVGAAPATLQIESGINVTTLQKKHGPSISTKFSFTVKGTKLACSRSINLIIFCY